MTDPRTKIRRPPNAAIVFAGLFLIVGHMIFTVIANQPHELEIMPGVYAGAWTGTLGYGWLFGFVLHALTWAEDSDPGRIAHVAPIAIVHKLSRDITLRKDQGPTDDGCMRQWHIPPGHVVVGTKQVLGYDWPSTEARRQCERQLEWARLEFAVGMAAWHVEVSS